MNSEFLEEYKEELQRVLDNFKGKIEVLEFYVHTTSHPLYIEMSSPFIFGRSCFTLKKLSKSLGMSWKFFKLKPEKGLNPENSMVSKPAFLTCDCSLSVRPVIS